MYEKHFSQVLRDTIASHSTIKSVYGEVFWVNNSVAVHGNVYS